MKSFPFPSLVFIAFSLLGAGASAAPAVRAGDYTEALKLANQGSKDIVVLQRGSDWNRLGEMLHREVWLKPEFADALGEGFVLVDVDLPEKAGSPSLLDGKSTNAAGEFLKATAATGTLPENGIASVKAGGGAFKPNAAGTMVQDLSAKPPPPPSDDIVLELKPGKTGRIVRLDFPPDTSLPNGGSGRASNGNFAVNEVEVRILGVSVPIRAAWASYAEASMTVDKAFDGISNVKENAWNPGAHTQQHRSLWLLLNQSIAAKSTVSITLVCKSQWNDHVPASIRAAILPDEELAAGLEAVSTAQRKLAKNKAFDWWDTTRCPRVAFLDKDGRAIASLDSPRSDLTPSSLARQIHDLREIRIARDELLGKAEKVEGPAKAELLRQALVTLGHRNWPGNGKCYQPIHEAIRAADPEDKSGATRWLGFSSDPKSGVPWAKPTWQDALNTDGGKKTLTEADYDQALARVDKELEDPRNNILAPEDIQKMMTAKFHIYRGWKGQEEKRFDVQRAIAAFNPNTFWGIGARGYLGMYCKSETPFLSYGWKPGQVKAGTNTWKMEDTAYFLDHAGDYTLTLSSAGGSSKVKVQRVAVLAGDEVLADSRPEKDLGAGGSASVRVPLALGKLNPARRHTVLVEIVAAAGQTDSHGKFSIEPVLTEPQQSDNPGNGAGSFRAAQSALAAKLRTALTSGGAAKVKSDKALQLDLARHELYRECGVDAVEEIAVRPGGREFLREFTADAAWMESFLVGDEAKWALALENLRCLYANSSELKTPLYRRLATAVALAAGDMNHWRLVDRYHAIVRTHKEGLLHASFDDLDVREMRWAILLTGTDRDYRFMVDNIQTRLSDYIGACWRIPYIDPNVYGYSVQGWGYIDPWTHHYGNGTGDRPFPIHVTVGGVCGTLSGFGAAATKAHGVMGTTVGQPAHCAYVVRVGDEWPTGNDVSGPETNGASVYEGTGFPTMHRLYEPINGNKPAQLASARLSWAAHVALDQNTGKARILPNVRYQVFKVSGGNIDAWGGQTPVATGTTNAIDLKSVQPGDPNNFVVLWEGQVEISGATPVSVSVKSDDGSRLTIAGKRIGGNQAAVEIPAGTHPFKLEYGQAGGNLGLEVVWSSVTAWSSGWDGLFEQAVIAHPINYPVLLEWLKTTETATAVPAGYWPKIARRIAAAYAPYHEAAWALTNRAIKQAAPTLTASQRMELILDCHGKITQAKAPKFMGYNLGGVLNQQADIIGDPQLAVTFFSKLLSIHYSRNPNANRVFGEVMRWGSTRFAGKPESAAAYAKVIGTFFEQNGKDVGANNMKEQITAGIRKASEASDPASYKLWTEMGTRFLPPLAPGDIFLNDGQFAAAPKLPLAGLLSADGVLQSSSVCEYDRPLSYRDIVSGTRPGWIDTNAESTPWIQIMLPGEAEISGIIAVNRYEYDPKEEEYQWAVPFKVLVSSDGKSWTEAGVVTKAENVMKVDMSAKPLRARYVRLERQAPSAPGQKAGRFHLRNFLVFGRKLF